MQVHVAGVSKRYGAVAALDDVTLAIPAGRTALLGPNGAGKSTLLKILLGLTAPTHGEVTVLGRSPRREPLAVRARVGYMPEDDAHLPDLTAVELCAYGAELCGLPRREAVERAHAALFYVGLDDKRYLPVQGYSAGLRQRVKLAAALAHDPDVLFLDEPTNGLDPRARDEMLALVADLKPRRGCDVVLSTHLLGDVERVCDHVVVLQGGRVATQCSVRELLGGADGRYLVRIKGDGARFAGALAARGCRVEPGGDAAAQTLLVTPPGADLDPVWQSAVETGVQVRHLAPHATSMDEAFLRVLA